MLLKSVEVSGSEMIDLVRQLKAQGHMVVAAEVGKRNSDWIVSYYEKDSQPLEQAEMFSSP